MDVIRSISDYAIVSNPRVTVHKVSIGCLRPICMIRTLGKMHPAISEIFARILFSRLALKEKQMYLPCKNFATRAFTYMSKRLSNFAILRGVYFHETSHARSFAKINPSRKFPILQ